MKVLVIQQKMIGDVLTSSILFEAIKQEHPSAELHFLINSNTLPVVINNPYIDKVIEFTPSIENSKLKFYKFLINIHKEKFDAVIDVYSKTSSALITYFSKAKIRVGKSKSYLSWAYTHHTGMQLIREYGIPLAYENRLHMLQPIIDHIDYSVIPKIVITDQEINDLKKKLTEQNIYLEKPTVMVNILGSAVDKTYPLPYLAEVLDYLTEHIEGISFLFNYIPNQIEEVIKLKAFCSPKTLDAVIDFYAPSLREFIVLTSMCNAMIGNEGGAIHMAKAVNIPAFAIFSPWIRKETWGKNDTDDLNLNVHLKDFRPDLFKNYNKKEFKKHQKEYYCKFEPKFFKDKLLNFIKKSIAN